MDVDVGPEVSRLDTGRITEDTGVGDTSTVHGVAPVVDVYGDTRSTHGGDVSCRRKRVRVWLEFSGNEKENVEPYEHLFSPYE